MEEIQYDQAFLEYVIKSIVDHPEDIEVHRKVDEMGVLLSVKAHHMDMGQIIGKKGETAKALRMLVKIVGVKNNARVNVKILEPDGRVQE